MVNLEIDVHAQFLLDLAGIVQMPLFWKQGIVRQAGKALPSCLPLQPEHLGQFFGRSGSKGPRPFRWDLKEMKVRQRSHWA